MSEGKDYSRREFMTKPLVYLASAGLLGASGRLAGAEALLATEASATGKVIQRRLGKTGLTLPVVSMGVAFTEIPGLLVRAYELGVRHFDTAATYQGGRSEEMLGNFVKEHGVRDKVVVATKVFLLPEIRKTGAAELKAQFLKNFEGSLRRLQMDYVDILYFHDVRTAADTNNLVVQELLADLKRQGKVRFSGISAHGSTVVVLNLAAQSGAYDVILVGLNFTMAENTVLLEAIKNAAAKGVGMIAMKTQAGGRWRKDSAALAGVPENIRQTAALKWVLQNEAITTAVPGATKYEHIDMDFSVASNLEYTPGEKQLVANVSLKASLEFCQQCGECVPSCPQHVDIPTLMRTHMYAMQYENNYHARVTLAEVPRENGLDVCRSCTSCRASCANTVNIPRKISELKTIQLA